MRLNRKLAYTLIEILVTLTIIGAISAGGYAVMRNVNQGAAERKLEQDVRMVNNAIKVYQAHGGQLATNLTADEAVVKLRRQSADTKKNAGLKGAVIDPRLNLQFQSTGEAMLPGKRAYWNATEKQFYLSDTGAQPGVKQFYIGEMPGPLPVTVDENGKVVDPNLDDRQTYGSFATVNHWVWDYDGSGSAPRMAPSFAATTDGGISNADGGLDDELIVLDPPQFSQQGGQKNLTWYPQSITLSPSANTPPNVSEIMYVVSGGAWQRYEAPIEINEPGISITAYTYAKDTDHFISSVQVTETYTAIPVTLDPAHTLQASYRYAELGGPLAPGSAAPVRAPTPRIYLANANDIPNRFERDTYFQSYWTWDGSSPAVASVGRYAGTGNFNHGYPGDPLELSVTSFGASNSLTLRYNTLSKNTAIFASSTVETASTTIATTPLLPPTITPGSGSLNEGESIVMALDVAGAATPADARIFYRTDGQDPGDNNGEPASGATLYTGPFTLSAYNSPTVRVVARAYPPTAYKRWFTSSPPTTLNYYLPYAEANVYAVLGGNKEIYSINPSSGTNQLFNNSAAYNLRALALDSAKARIYYLEENFTSVSTTGWRLGYYDLLASNHVTIGNIRGGWGYSANLQPQNLCYFNNGLYYVHSNSDDLVQIALNETADGISSITKVADLRNNVVWTTIGDLAIDETGLLFFVDSARGYHRFDLVTMSGYLALGSAAEDFLGLAFFQGRLFGTQTRTTAIHRLAATTGKTISSVASAGSRRFIDLASPSSATPVSTAKSMWGIDDQGDGPHLIEFRNNYRSPLISVAIDYGVMTFDNSALKTDTRYGFRGMAITDAGVAYMALNSSVKVGPQTYQRPLFKFNLSTLRLGDPLEVTYVGDLEPSLKAIAGNLDPDDVVTGIALAPTGELYGILREGNSSGENSADYLFKCTQAAGTMSSSNIGAVALGRTTSAEGHSSHTEDLVFSRDGRLFCVDAHDNEVLELNPQNGSVLSLMSQNAGRYHGLAIDTNDYRMVASDVGGGGADSFLMVNGGPNNDEVFLNYRDRWGYTTIEAISFFQAPFLLLSTQVDLFATDGTKTVHGLDFSTGQTVPVTDAPWPVRALAYDLEKREVYYLRGGSSSFTLGSFSRDTFIHKLHGDLRGTGFEYTPMELPDNLMYFGGYLWYVEPKTDNLIRVEMGVGGGGGSTGTPNGGGIALSLFNAMSPSSYGNDNDYELGMRFRATTNGTITQLRYFRPAQETGSHTGKLWSASGSLLASVAFTGETSSGWQTATLATPVTVTANTTYVVSVNNNTAYAIASQGLFNQASNGALQSVADGSNGVFHGTPGSFPSSSWQNSNYFRDVTFVPEGGGTAGGSGNGNIVAQRKVSNLTGNELRFDLIGDLAMTPDGWMYFSAIRSDGQRFCRYNINTLGQFQVLSGPIPAPVLLPEGDTYRENWFDALAFAPADAQGGRQLYSTYAASPSPLHTVDASTGISTFHKNVLPSISIIDFSDLHPGALQNPNAVTLRPLLKLNNLQASYTYADVGGPFLTGFVPPPSPVAGPTVVLSNANEISIGMQNSNHFQVRWCTDGMDPRTSPNASTTGSFTNGFPGQEISVAYNLWGNRSSLPLKVVAKSLQTNVLADSPVLQPTIPTARLTLDDPLITETASINGDRAFAIQANIAGGMIPPGTRIFYTINDVDPGVVRDSNGLDNPVTGQPYTGPIVVANNQLNGQKDFLIRARLYPPVNLPQWFAASDLTYFDVLTGSGHMDLDTSSKIYPYRRGKTDGHVHAYDKHFNTTGADFFNLYGGKLHNITDNVTPGMRFKIIVANADLSPGGRLVINRTYNPYNPTTWIPVTIYDDTAPSALTIYSLDGAPGTTRLTSFGLYFDMTTIGSGGLIQGNTGHVKNNTPGIYGEWRNGALTIQVVRVNADGSDGFTVNTDFSGGGIQGVATTGLLWELTAFHHGSGGPYSPN